MKKEAVFPLLFALATIAAIYFAVLYFKERNAGDADKQALAEVRKSPSLKDFLHGLSPFTEPILPADATEFATNFDQTLNAPIGGKKLFPNSVWVDKNVILSEFSKATVDGFRITPIRYTKDGSSTSGHSQYKKDSVNFMITLTSPTTGGHKDIPEDQFDYNDPCPPSCPKP